MGRFASGSTYTVVTHIALLGLTVSDVVVLSAAVTWVTVPFPFRYCGGNTNVGELGLAISGAGGYVGWVGNTVKKTGPCDLKTPKKNETFTEKGRKSERSSPSK